MDSNKVADRLVRLAAQIGSSIAAKQVAAANQSKPATQTSARAVRRR